MKYLIDKSDLLIDNKLHPEGSIIEITKEQTKGIEDFLIPLNNEESKKKIKTKSSALSTVASAKVEAKTKEGKGNKK